jgi:hypothetical protein
MSNPFNEGHRSPDRVEREPSSKLPQQFSDAGIVLTQIAIWLCSTPDRACTADFDIITTVRVLSMTFNVLKSLSC